MVQAGVVNALVALSKAESENSRELLARVFLAVCKDPKYRGLVVQQGGAKVIDINILIAHNILSVFFSLQANTYETEISL